MVHVGDDCEVTDVSVGGHGAEAYKIAPSEGSAVAIPLGERAAFRRTGSILAGHAEEGARMRDVLVVLDRPDGPSAARDRMRRLDER